MELKYLTEQRSENQEKMQKILDTAKLEKRALSEEEIAKFNELKKLIDEIDATIKAEDEARKMDMEDEITEVLNFETHPMQGRLAITALKGRDDLKAVFSKDSII